MSRLSGLGLGGLTGWRAIGEARCSLKARKGKMGEGKKDGVRRSAGLEGDRRAAQNPSP
jgi:hypothetical protein